MTNLKRLPMALLIALPISAILASIAALLDSPLAPVVPLTAVAIGLHRYALSLDSTTD